jgi:hypothetical protein
MERIIAYCGIVCSECDAYVATQANDLETLERLARRAHEEFGMEGATAETTMCDGCLTDDGRQITYCATCEIRACAVERGLVNCAHCTDYACDRLEGFFAQETDDVRSTLNEVRQSL